MKRKLGTACMILGAALLIAALSLFVWNRYEDYQAGNSVTEILHQLEEQVSAGSVDGSAEDGTDGNEVGNADGSAEDTADSGEEDDAEDGSVSTEMTEVEIDGYLYIGYVSIPSLGLELPVMSDWSYPQLKIAPCRYYGSTKTDDLVIAAHNYSQHFGNIKSLTPGDAVYFTDMDGVTTAYEVVEVDTLNPTAVEEMTSSGYSLTLFTCTYSGQSRVTVRCDRVE